MEEKLTSLIAPLCHEEGIFLLEVSLHGGGRDRTVRVIVDTETGVTLDQCQSLSQAISDLFYQKEIFAGGDYRLEVMSPGVTKNLEHPYEFKRSVGKTLKVKYREGDEIVTVTGEMFGFNNDKITLKVGDEERIIALTDIEQAKIKLKW